MPYIITKTDGSVLTTVADGTLDKSTSLTFVGKNFSGYGSPIEENFIGLLENFANATPPTKPIKGQLWFNTNNRQLYVSGDGKTFKGIGSITVGPTTSITAPVNGDFFWTDGSLYGYDPANGYVLVGPTAGSTYSSWQFGRELSNYVTQNAYYPSIVGILGNKPMVTFSNASYIPDPSTNIGVGSFNTFTQVQTGITLPGAQLGSPPIPKSTAYPPPGSTINSGYYFWGTAAESLASVAVELTNTTSNTTCYVPFTKSSSSTGTQALATSPAFYYNPSNNVLNTTATSAYYADLAERYEADAVYEPGTVVIIGGEKEVTVTTVYADHRVAGVISTNPAYRMNSDAGSDETHPYIALRGRVPCKVIGPVVKGALLVTSSTPGHAESWPGQAPVGTIIGKALENATFEGSGVIEILV
jgi:hypothetical protein